MGSSSLRGRPPNQGHSPQVTATHTTGLRSGEIRGLVWDAVDLTGKQLFVERQATRRRDDDTTKAESSLRAVPVPGYLIPELKRWKVECPLTTQGLVFPGEPDTDGQCRSIEADKLLRNIFAAGVTQGRTAPAALPRHAPLGQHPYVRGRCSAQAGARDFGPRRYSDEARELHP